MFYMYFEEIFHHTSSLEMTYVYELNPVID